jgi:uncharacterized membrane protein
MDWTSLAFLIPGISAPIYVIAGFFLMRYPPRRINNLYGYRTPRSTRSQQSWDFAQEYSSRQMTWWGFVMFIAALLAGLINTSMSIQFLIGVGVLFFFTAIPIYKTERELRLRFKS